MNLARCAKCPSFAGHPGPCLLVPATVSATVGEGGRGARDIKTARVRVLKKRPSRPEPTKTGQARPTQPAGAMMSVCISISADDLRRIDEEAVRCGINRSAYLISCALACAGQSRAEIEAVAWKVRCQP
jgi:hypothetical protein